MLATFMEVLDTSVANVALNHIAGSLSASTDEATWVLTSYLVSNAIILPATGGISAITTMVSRGAQTHQALLVGQMSQFNPVFNEQIAKMRSALMPQVGSAAAHNQAYGLIYQTLQQQTSLWSYVDQFRILVIVATFTLKPGNYTLDFAAVRKLNFRAYGARRFVNGAAPLPLRGLSATTSRTFDLNDNETNGTGAPPLPVRNELAKRLFDKGAISPEDDWTFELIPEEILGLPAGTAIGTEEPDLSEIQDVVLSMEYEIT
jgi:hypothetical protein